MWGWTLPKPLRKDRGPLTIEQELVRLVTENAGLQERVRTLEDALKADIRAFDYYTFHRTAAIDPLLYESHNSFCPEHTVDRRKREAQQALDGE
jgi:hypothetical protein